MASSTSCTSQGEAFPPLECVRFCRHCQRWYFFPSARAVPRLCTAWPCIGALKQPDQGTYDYFQQLWGELRAQLGQHFTWAEVCEIARLRWLREMQDAGDGARGQAPGYTLAGRLAAQRRPSLPARLWAGLRRRALWWT